VAFAVGVVVIVVVGICSSRRTLSSSRTCALSTLSSSCCALSAALSFSHACALATLSSSRRALSAAHFAICATSSSSRQNYQSFVVIVGVVWLLLC